MNKSISVSLLACAMATVPSLVCAQVCPVSNGIAICPIEQKSEQKNGLVVALGAAVLVWGLYTVYNNNTGNKAALSNVYFDVNNGISQKINRNTTITYLGVRQYEHDIDNDNFAKTRSFGVNEYRIGLVGYSHKF